VIIASVKLLASEFDPVKHFKTSEEFLGRTFNRPRLDQIGEGASSSQMDTEKLKVIQLFSLLVRKPYIQLAQNIGAQSISFHLFSEGSGKYHVKSSGGNFSVYKFLGVPSIYT
jgi:hypothetical protein